MQKRGILFVFLFSLIALMVVNFVSAAFHYGGIGNFFDTVGSGNLVLFLIFGVSGIILSFSLKKYFEGMGGILALLIALGITAGAHFTGIAYSFEGFLFGIGISEGILYTIVPLILLSGFLYISYSKIEKRFKFYIGFLVLGGLLIGIVILTDIIYEGSKGIVFILGAILLGIGILLWRRGRRRRFVDPYYQNYDTYSGPSQRQVYKQQRAQQRYQQKLENQGIMGEQRQQQKLADRTRQAHEAEVRRKAGKIAKIRKRREKNNRAKFIE